MNIVFTHLSSPSLAFAGKELKFPLEIAKLGAAFAKPSKINPLPPITTTGGRSNGPVYQGHVEVPYPAGKSTRFYVTFQPTIIMAPKCAPIVGIAEFNDNAGTQIQVRVLDSFLGTEDHGYDTYKVVDPSITVTMPTLTAPYKIIPIEFNEGQKTYKPTPQQQFYQSFGEKLFKIAFQFQPEYKI